MSSFQLEALQALQDIASEQQLERCPLAVSGNGIEYKNHLSSTVMTVYHNRLDTENSDAIEIAVGCDNIAKELSISTNSVTYWMANLQQYCPTAKAKPPQRWPRIALRSRAQLDQFHEDFRKLYSRESLSSTPPETEKAQTTTRPPSSVDERLLREIQTRRGQSAFRAKLIRAYGACAISGCADMEALEAAHITPHSIDEDYRTPNGLLLRADIHTLFDLRLISVDPRSGKVVIAASLGTTYRQYEGQLLRLPADPKNHPDPRGLMGHFQGYVSSKPSNLSV